MRARFGHWPRHHGAVSAWPSFSAYMMVRMASGDIGKGPYDAAVSFLARDEALAIELAESLSGNLEVFVYSERQRELVGREGMSEFTRVFERDSRIVVVLYRAGWGATPWTGVESTAIQERGFRKQWEFLVFAALDSSAVPDWLPKTRIWLDFDRYGIAGLAAVVKQRFQDAGGTPRVEDAVEMARRLRREQDAEAVRQTFVKSTEGVTAAEAESAQFFDEVQRIAAAVREEIPMALERDGNRAIWLYRAGHTMSARWNLGSRSTLDGSSMVLGQYTGRVGPGRYANFGQEPELDSEQLFSFNVDAARLPFWETDERPRQRYSSKGLAEEAVKLVLGFSDDED